MAGHDPQQALELLDDLLHLTEQLMLCENDPEVDIQVLADSCEERFGLLQTVFEQQRGAGKGENFNWNGEIEQRMRRLDARALHCMEVLNRCMERTSTDLAALRQFRRASRAYRSHRLPFRFGGFPG